MPLQLDKLRLSTRQEFTANTHASTSNWPQTFLWTEGLILLNWAKSVVAHALPELDLEAQEGFWRGIIPGRLLDRLPARLAWCSPAQLVEYCQAWRSQDRAWSILITQARREKLNPQGLTSLGEVRLDEKVWVLRKAEVAKDLTGPGMFGLICEAARQNDVRFFIRLGKALQSRKPPPEVDWKRADPVACFLVANWCEGQDYHRRLPALCFFTDQALADFCSAAFGKKPGNPSSESVRQWRRRLGLKPVRRPKVRQFLRQGDEIMFA